MGLKALIPTLTRITRDPDVIRRACFFSFEKFRELKISFFPQKNHLISSQAFADQEKFCDWAVKLTGVKNSAFDTTSRVTELPYISKYVLLAAYVASKYPT